MQLQREAITEQACDTHEVCIMRQDRPSQYAIADIKMQDATDQRKTCQFGGSNTPNSLVLHAFSCSSWSDAKWDQALLNHATQIWYLPRHDKSRRSGVCMTTTVGSDANLPLRIQHN